MKSVLKFLFIYFLQQLKNVKWFENPEQNATCCQGFCHKLTNGNSTTKNVLAKFIWVISTARNAIIVIICTIIAYGFDPVVPDKKHERNATFILTGKWGHP